MKLAISDSIMAASNFCAAPAATRFAQALVRADPQPSTPQHPPLSSLERSSLGRSLDFSRGTAASAPATKRQREMRQKYMF